MLTPALYAVAGINGVAIAAGGSLGPIAFRWPQDHFVTGILVVPQSGDPADLGAVSLAVSDEDQDALFTASGLVPGDVALGALVGGLPLPFDTFPHVQPFPLQRPVRAGDVWRFTLTNGAGAPVTLSMFLFFDRR